MISEATTLLIGKGYIDGNTVEEFVNWAYSELESGKDSNALRILAGFPRNHFNDQEVEMHFKRAMAELNYLIPDKETAIIAYAKQIARGIVSQNIPPSVGCSKMYQICRALERWQLVGKWNDLCANTPPNFDVLIREEASRFLDSLHPDPSQGGRIQ